MYNNTGYIPTLAKVQVDGKEYYFRIVYDKDVFRMYQGVGLSSSKMKSLSGLGYIIRHDSEKTRVTKWYLTSIDRFRTSELSYDNRGDVQKIVQFKDMKEIVLLTLDDGKTFTIVNVLPGNGTTSSKGKETRIVRDKSQESLGRYFA